MSERSVQRTVVVPPDAALRWVKYVLAGGAAGMVIGILVLFVAALLFGESLGLAGGQCVLLGCALTLMVSQPVGAVGMLIGAAVGAVAGAVLHHTHGARPN